MKHTSIARLLAILTITPAVRAAAPDPIYADNGIVVSASAHASEAGGAIMKKGGNAFDADTDSPSPASLSE